MFQSGDVISYLDMCREEMVNLQRGMNFRLRGGLSVILMSLRAGAPYADRIEENGKILIYEGHDIPSFKDGPKPKEADQPERNPGGGLTQNGLFLKLFAHIKIENGNLSSLRFTRKLKLVFGFITGYSNSLTLGMR